MATIGVKFHHDGKEIKRTAVLNDSLEELSGSKKNQATDIMDYSEDGYWSIIFDEENGTMYEVEFEYSDYCKTKKPIKVVIWENDIIIDVQKVEIKIR